MTTQTDGIVVQNRFFKVFAVSDTDPVAMRIMAFPAGKAVCLKF